MTQRKTHTGKSKYEKDYYSRQIKNLDYEPTVDETINFPETESAKRDYSVPKSSVKRKPKIKQQIIDHFEENWLKWVVGFVALFLLYFLVDSKVDIKGIDTKVDIIKEDVNELKQNQRDNVEKIHQQDMKIQENKFHIEEIDKTKNAKK